MYYAQDEELEAESMNEYEPSEIYDVAIVGYGPGGQCLAALLGAMGHRVAAFERYPHLYNLPRAGHIDHEALRMVQSIGDADRLAATLWEVRDEYVWINQDGAVLMLQPALERVDAVSGWYSDFTQWQPNLERELDAGARAAGVEVNLGWQVVALTNSEDRVELTVNRVQATGDGKISPTPETRKVGARYVVGADGANGFVRPAMGIARDDLGFNERWLVVDLETLRPVTLRPNIGQICDPARPTLVMPLGTSHRRFEWMLLPGETDTEMERPETAWGLLAEFGVTPQSHKIARQIVYTFEARTAEQWRRERVLLSGDAAHTMPPYAGQGLLSSLRDSNNLAWKLDLVLRGLVPEALLDSYEQERRPHVQSWTEISLAEGRVSCELDPVKAAARDARFLSGEKLAHPPAPKLERGILQLAPRHEIVGTLGLQARIRAADREGRFDDLMGSSRFTVLTVSEAPQSVLSDSQLDELYQLDAVVARVVAPGGPTSDGLVDIDGRYRAYFDKHGIAAFISRPDFYVFGVVNELKDLPALVDALLSQLKTGGTRSLAHA
jgi:2-polyprenyl-6-methoxyphenol hydroxylase-like FAD-dependent oxidoreductase